MSTESCIYEGTVRHRRLRPRRAFEDRVAMAYVDLGELPQLLGGRFVRRPPGLNRFRRRDYHGDPELPLLQAVRDTVQRETGERPEGPVRVLTQLRSFGHCFNPVSFYYCFAGDGRSLQAVLAEVTNTPWGERHAYVMPGESGSFAKAMHVSPFMTMDHTYTSRAPAPGRQLSVTIENRRDGELVFEVALALSRVELTAASMRVFNRRYPLATVRILALIYGHALGLRLAGVRTVPHPGRSRA